MNLGDLLKSVAPTIATALGGPLAGAAVSFLSSKLGVDPSIVEQTVAGMTPDDLVKMKGMDLEFQEHMADNGIKLDVSQLAVDQAEASNPKEFVSGWRPFIGWVCGFSLAYVGVVEPIARFVANVFFTYKGTFPVIDTDLTMQVLLGMLGMSGLRSYDKKQGTARV